MPILRAAWRRPHSCHRCVKNCRAKERFSPRIRRYISAQPSSDCKSISGVGRARRVSSSTHRALGRVNRVAERHANPAYRWRALGYFANPLNAGASRSFIRGLSARIFQLLMLSSRRPARSARHMPITTQLSQPKINQILIKLAYFETGHRGSVRRSCRPAVTESMPRWH